MSYNIIRRTNVNHITTYKFIVILTTRLHELIQLSTNTIPDRSMLHHLTLGRNKPDGGYVTDLDWQMYCQEVLDSNFDGYTITDAVGTWKSDLEDTKIVIINTTNQDKVEDVAWLYKDMFDQEAVGHYVTSPMEFI